MRALVCLTVLVFGVIACEPLEDAFLDPGPPDPTCIGDDVNLAGIWVIEGSGERFGCDDDTFDTPLFRLSSVPLEIVQDGVVFELADPGLRASFTLYDGLVDGRCFDFKTSEVTALGTIDYEWDGLASGDAPLLTGQFTGTGPSGCAARGTFRVDLTPAP